jgi:Lipocalin-like domain
MNVKSLHKCVIIMALLAILLPGAACKKDDVKPSAQDLISRSWILTDLLATLNGITESVYDDEFDACDQDNLYNFTSDGKFTVTENTIKCDPAGPQPLTSGTWVLLENSTKITIDPIDEDPLTLNIEELTSTSFKASVTDNSIGIPVKITFIYAAK